MVTDRQLEAYRRDGFALVGGLFSAAEVAQLREHYMRLREAGNYPGDFGGSICRARTRSSATHG
jgi:hypothetical protein